MFCKTIAAIGEGNGNPLQCFCLAPELCTHHHCQIPEHSVSRKRLRSHSPFPLQPLIYCQWICLLWTFYENRIVRYVASYIWSFICSVAQSCLIICNPMDCIMPGFPVLHCRPEFAQTHVYGVMSFNHLILCRPLLLLPSVFPSIKVFSNESTQLFTSGG